ncbi:hypothetical protein CCH79_00005385, partial [Gambusia affinis]
MLNRYSVLALWSGGEEKIDTRNDAKAMKAAHLQSSLLLSAYSSQIAALTMTASQPAPQSEWIGVGIGRLTLYHEGHRSLLENVIEQAASSVPKNQQTVLKQEKRTTKTSRSYHRTKNCLRVRDWRGRFQPYLLNETCSCSLLSVAKRRSLKHRHGQFENLSQKLLEEQGGKYHFQTSHSQLRIEFHGVQTIFSESLNDVPNINQMHWKQNHQPASTRRSSCSSALCTETYQNLFRGMSCTVNAVHPGNPSCPAVYEFHYMCLSQPSRQMAPFYHEEIGNVPLDQADLQVVCTGRRRTCALLNTPSPCASSAICHIQDMRSQLKMWFQKRLSMKVLDSDSKDLYVEGIAITARGYEKSPLQGKIEDVLSEVMHLVERLEADRQFAEEALQKEKRRRSILVSKIDGISLWKLSEHPAIIQKEHEACSRDITELKWQLKLENQKIDEVQEKLFQAELLIRKLQEDIEFARNQMPIVKENSDRQKDVIHLLQIAQTEADDIQESTKHDYLQIEMELAEMETDAHKERIAHKHRHEDMLHQLDDRLKELNRLKMHQKHLLSAIKKTKEAICLQEKKYSELLKQLAKIAKFEKTEEDKVSHLNLHVEKEVKTNQQLEDKLVSIKEELETKKSTWEADLTFSKAQLHSRNEALAALLKENQAYEQQIYDYKTKICKSEKDVKQMRAERKQMLQKIIDDDEHWEKAEDELTEVLEQYSIKKDELDKQERLIIKEDHEAVSLIENLRKDLTHRMTTLEKLKNQIAEINSELKKHEECSHLTNRGLEKEFNNLFSATEALEAKLKKMKELVENFEKIQSEHEEVLANLQKEISLKSDQLEAARDLHRATLQKIKDNNARCTVLMNKTKEYQESSHEFKKMTEAIPKIIADLEKDLDVVDFKNKSAAHTMSTLQSDINNWQLRIQRLERTSLAHLIDRRKLVEETEGLLEVGRAENKQLAIEYKDLRKMLLEARQESVSALTLSLLQKRMHKVLVKYLEQRSFRFLVDLEECQGVARLTSQKISTAQGNLSKEIQLITAFLQSVRENATTTKNAEKSKQTSPDATESRSQ